MKKTRVSKVDFLSHVVFTFAFLVLAPLATLALVVEAVFSLLFISVGLSTKRLEDVKLDFLEELYEVPLLIKTNVSLLFEEVER